MDTFAIIGIFAAAAALATFSLVRWLMWYLRSDQRRLKQRLEGEPRRDPGSPMQRSIVIQQQADPLPPGLGRLPLLRSLQRRLCHAYPNASFTTFMAIMGGMGTIFAAVAYVMVASLPIGAAAGAFGAYVPVLVVNRKRATRQRILVGQLPEALDFLARILRAGHSLSTGIQMMGQELPQPIAAEFARCYDQHSLGQSLDLAMRSMAARVDCSDFAFFVTAVLIQRETGGDLAEVLSHISGMIRNRIRLAQHVQAITAEGRLTGNILVAFPMILFAISYALNPQYTGILVNTGVGKALLGSSLALQVLGLFVIRRIVTVRA